MDEMMELYLEFVWTMPDHSDLMAEASKVMLVQQQTAYHKMYKAIADFESMAMPRTWVDIKCVPLELVGRRMHFEISRADFIRYIWERKEDRNFGYSADYVFMNFNKFRCCVDRDLPNLPRCLGWPEVMITGFTADDIEFLKEEAWNATT